MPLPRRSSGLPSSSYPDDEHARSDKKPRATQPVPHPAPTRVPAVVLLVAVIGVVVILGPVLALTVRVDWAQFFPVLTEEDSRELLAVTIYAAVQATIITVVLGVPLAVAINSSAKVGARAVRLLVMLPLAMPPVVAGLALTAAVGRRGLLAPLLDALGIQFAFAFPGVVLSHTFVALPFVVVSVDSALRQIDREILASAAGVGMRPGEILRKITLPAIGPAVATGAGLAFARSLGEFGTTLTFAGSMPGVTRTMPIGIYLERELDQDRAYVLAAILILLAIIVLALAMVPTLFQRTPTPRPHTIEPLDTERMRKLTRPAGGGTGVTITTRGATTEFPAGTITALIGPNGSGKTTLAGLIAGRLRGADVTANGVVVDSTASKKFVPAQERGIVLLTQRPGLPRTATARQAITMATRDGELTAKLLAASGLNDLADTPVPALSGGQAAQVALVRALGARPGVLILDEPLAAIDVDSTARWRRLLRAAGADRTTIMITHDPVDLAGLSQRVAVMQAGRTVSQVSTEELFRLPPTDFAARLSGVNRLEGTLESARGAGAGLCTATVSGHLIIGELANAAAGDHHFESGQAAVVTFAPNAVTLARDPRGKDDGRNERAEFATDGSAGGARVSARNRWRGTVLAIDSSPADAGAGGSVIVTVGLGEGAQLTTPITTAAAVELALEPGVSVECLVKATAITVCPAASRLAGA